MNSLENKILYNRPLISNSLEDYSKINNILLIDGNLSDVNIFYKNSNANTFPIIYYNNSSRKDLLDLLEAKFKKIDRIAIVTNNGGVESGKVFLNDEYLFYKTDLESNVEKYSDNVKFMIDLIKKFNIQYYDYLACNTLLYDIWNEYYSLINNQTSVIIGASDNKTGNIKYGGDWVMESTHEDIKNIYFTDGIKSYSNTLDTLTLSTNGTIYLSQDSSFNIFYGLDPSDTIDITPDNWPISLSTTTNSSGTLGNLELRLISDITLNNADSIFYNKYFIIINSNITFNGNGYKFIINNNNIYYNYSFYGLIENGTENTNGYNNIIIQNLGVTAINDANLGYQNGWIGKYYFAKGSLNNLINNCYSTGDMNYAGGILGHFSASNRGELTIQNCYSTGNIGNSSAGILLTDNTFSSIIINNCYSLGDISLYSSGIISCLSYNSNINTNTINLQITNCYSLGNISTDSYGIFNNTLIYVTLANITISYCYNTGIISTSSISNSFSIFNEIYSSNNITFSNCFGNGLCCNDYIFNQNNNISSNYYNYSSGWNDTTANTFLTQPSETVSNWFSNSSNTPYLLKSIISTNYPYIKIKPNSVNVRLNTDPSEKDITFTIIAYPNSSNLTYQWYDNSGIITNAISSSYSVCSTQNYNKYYVILKNTVTTGGVSTSYQTISNKVSISNYIDSNISLNNYIANLYIYPVTVYNSSSTIISINFTSDITFNNISDYFIIQNDKITFNGNNNNIILENISNQYDGLIQNGTSSLPGYSYIKIQNINLIINNSNSIYQCCIGKPYFGYKSDNNRISNCTSYGYITNYGVAGDNGSITIDNCKSIYYSIIGISSYFNTINIYNCSSYNSIVDNYCGYNINSSRNCTLNIINCYTFGPTILNTGGIIGNNFGENNGKPLILNITNCYSLGNMNGSNNISAGGICGMINSTSYADISGNYYYPILTINNCYSNGITNDTTGGIIPLNFPYTPTITNCYASDGTWIIDNANANLLINTGIWIQNNNDPYLLTSNSGYTSPTITVDTSSYSIQDGLPVTFNVNLECTLPYIATWYYQSTLNSSKTSVQSRNNSFAYTIESVTNSNAGYYTLSVTDNSSNIVTTNDNPIQLIVTPPVYTPIFLTNLDNTQTLFTDPSSNYTFSVSVYSRSSDVSYQWYLNSNSIANSASYTITNATLINSGRYYVIATNSFGSITSNSALLIVNQNPEIVTNLPTSETSIQGSNITFSISVLGDSTLNTYQWYFTDSSGNTSSIPNNNYLYYNISSINQSFNQGTYNVLISNSYNNLLTTMSSYCQLIITIPINPNILSQTQSPQTVNEGDTITFFVTANGSDPLSYQWYFNTTDPSNSITGAINSTFTITNANTSNQGKYYVIVSNTYEFATTSAISLNVNTPFSPYILVHPQTQTLGYNQSFSLSVDASGTSPLKYQWYKNSEKINEATSSTYSSKTENINQNDEYCVEVSNDILPNATSKVATITVTDSVVGPSILTDLESSKSTSTSDSVTLFINADGTQPLTYKWYFNDFFLTNSNSNTFTISTPISSNSGKYYVNVSNSKGNKTSKTCQLTVTLPAPTITFINPFQIATTTSSQITSQITINGSYFTKSSKVNFGSIELANVTYINSTKLVVVIPSSSSKATVNFTVTTSNGTSNISAFNYVSVPDSPTISNVSTGIGNVTVSWSSIINTTTYTVILTNTEGYNKLQTTTSSTTTTITNLINNVSYNLLIYGTNDIGNSQTYVYPKNITSSDAPTITSISPNFGSTLGGGTLIITGTNFLNPTVKLGTENISDLIDSSNTLISFIIPKSTSSGATDLIVTSSGASVGLGGGFIYYTPPSISTISPINVSSFGGKLIRIRGSNFNGLKNVYFGTTAGNLISYTNSLINLTVPSLSGVQPVKIITIGGTTTYSGTFTFVDTPTLTSAIYDNTYTILTIIGTNFVNPNIKINSIDEVNISTSSDNTTITITTTTQTSGDSLSISITTDGGNITFPYTV